jgi:hypothetical protein
MVLILVAMFVGILVAMFVGTLLSPYILRFATFLWRLILARIMVLILVAMFDGILVAIFIGTLLSPYISMFATFLWRLISATFNRFFRRDRVFACGILTSTGITKDNLDDHWQATDFVAIQSLLNCAEGQSFWLCGTDIRSGLGFLLGDPGCDRLVFDPPPFEEIFDTSNPKSYQKLSRFKSAYIRRVGETASRLTSGDILCLVICGHGLPDGRVVVGDAEARTLLVKSNLEDAVESCKAEVHLFITACYGGSWTSPYWNLFAAAESY